MNINNLFDALKYGLIGLGAILAVLCFFLLNKEQSKARPRKKILTSIYIFMGFSCLILVLGIVGQNDNSQKNLFEPKSGFASGSLDGKWKIQARDTSVFNNSDFKTPIFMYEGVFELKENKGEINYKGFLLRKKIHDTTFNKDFEMQFEANGPLNNTYVAAQYYVKTERTNGLGTMLTKFNNAADSAVAYFLFRPSVTDISFGLVYGKLTRIK